MCVSAEASFGLTGILVPVGIYCLTIANHRDRSSLPIAAIPLLFGIQQFAEGMVWVGLSRGNADLTHVAAMIYLFFALAFWLFWIPYSAIFLERRKTITHILGIGAVLGLLGGATLFAHLAFNPGSLQVSLIRHSIYYDYADPPALVVAPQIVWHLFYVAVISLPLILLREKLLIGYCIALVVSALVSHVFYWYAFASVWCFFAAGISLYVCYIFRYWPIRRAAE